MKRIVPSISSMTCAATAGWTTPGSIPVPRSIDSVSEPKAATKDKACRVGPGSPAILAPSRSSSVFGTGNGSEWCAVRSQDARQLHREERVPARLLTDAQQGLPAEARSESVEEQTVQGSGAQRPDRHTQQVIWRECPLNSVGLRSVERPPSEQHQNGTGREPAEAQRRARRMRTHPATGRHRRQPGSVRVLAELLEHIAHREGDGTVVDRGAGGRVAEHRDAERTPSAGPPRSAAPRRGPLRAGRRGRRGREPAPPRPAATRAP